jgi:hypothetical protein
MNNYLIKYIDPDTGELLYEQVAAEDRTQARDNFFECHSNIDLIERITTIKPNV